MNKELIEMANRIRAISQNGLVYSLNNYDTDRYKELLEISNRVIALVSGHNIAEIEGCLSIEKDYVTPKVDIRAAVFNDSDQILLVKESADGLWSLPGGWADVGYSPKEVAVKEVAEETGLIVEATKLVAVMDKKCHPHPAALHYVYKIFIMCRIVGGEFGSAFDILDRGFFSVEDLPPLSVDRVLKSQIDLMFEYHKDTTKEAVID